MFEKNFERFTHWRYAKIALAVFEAVFPVLPIAFFAGPLLWLFVLLCVPAVMYRFWRNQSETLSIESVFASVAAAAVVYVLVLSWSIVRGML